MPGWYVALWQSGPPIYRLRGRILGLLSFGAIARAMSHRAAVFGITVIAYDPFVDPATMEPHHVEPVSFDQLLKRSDFLVIQAPLNSATHNLFDESNLRRLKPTSIVVNTARGPIVNDRALYQPLKEGWIPDDIAEEPTKQHDWQPTNLLFTLDKAMITPYAACYSEEFIRTVCQFAAEEVVRAR